MLNYIFILIILLTTYDILPQSYYYPNHNIIIIKCNAQVTSSDYNIDELLDQYDNYNNNYNTQNDDIDRNKHRAQTKKGMKGGMSGMRSGAPKATKGNSNSIPPPSSSPPVNENKGSKTTLEDTLETARLKAEEGKSERARMEAEREREVEEERKRKVREARDRKFEDDLKRMDKQQRDKARRKRKDDAKVINKILNAGEDLYSIMGIKGTWWNPLSNPTSISQSGVKKRYRNLARKIHPDKNRDSGAEEAFDIVQDAYEVLSDKMKKREYDRKRERMRVNKREERKEMVNEGAGKVWGTARVVCKVVSTVLGPASTSFFLLGALII